MTGYIKPEKADSNPYHSTSTGVYCGYYVNLRIDNLSIDRAMYLKDYLSACMSINGVMP